MGDSNMTNQELLALANSHVQGETRTNATKEAAKPKEIKTPTTVLEISRDYVEDFL